MLIENFENFRQSEELLNSIKGGEENVAIGASRDLIRVDAQHPLNALASVKRKT